MKRRFFLMKPSQNISSFLFLTFNILSLLFTSSCANHRRLEKDLKDPLYQEGKLNPLSTANESMAHSPTTNPTMALTNLLFSVSQIGSYYESSRIGGVVTTLSEGNVAIPYQAIGYQIKLIQGENESQLIAQSAKDTQTNSQGEFEFYVEDQKKYYLKILNPKGEDLKKLYGPFKKGDFVTLQLKK
jgi:hypothetical protein